MTVQYIIQENWDNEGWKDFLFGVGLPKDKEDADKQLKELTTNPIWDGEGKRKWRMIQRTIVDVEMMMRDGNVFP